MKREDPPRPEVRVRLAEGLEEARAQIEAGLEEEGVPGQSAWGPERVESRAEAAHAEAVASRLGVGVWVDASGACLHLSRLPVKRAFLVYEGADREAWRRLGQNAARVVKGIPMLALNEDERFDT